MEANMADSVHANFLYVMKSLFIAPQKYSNKACVYISRVNRETKQENYL